MENFKSFITEQKNESYRVVVISNELGEKAITAKRMREEADKLKYPNYVVPMDGTYTVFNDGLELYINKMMIKGLKYTRMIQLYLCVAPQKETVI